MKLDVIRIGAICGALAATTTLAVGFLDFLDRRIIYVVQEHEREKQRQRICAAPLQDDPIKDAPILEARRALGGCSG